MLRHAVQDSLAIFDVHPRPLAIAYFIVHLARYHCACLAKTHLINAACFGIDPRHIVRIDRYLLWLARTTSPGNPLSVRRHEALVDSDVLAVVWHPLPVRLAMRYRLRRRRGHEGRGPSRRARLWATRAITRSRRCGSATAFRRRRPCSQNCRRSETAGRRPRGSHTTRLRFLRQLYQRSRPIATDCR